MAACIDCYKVVGQAPNQRACRGDGYGSDDASGLLKCKTMMQSWHLLARQPQAPAKPERCPSSSHRPSTAVHWPAEVAQQLLPGCTGGPSSPAQPCNPPSGRSPSAKGARGTPTMGDATLMNVLGRMGVTRRNTI